MLVTIAIILFVLWLLGIVSGIAIGWYIHPLLILAIIAVLIRIIYGEYPFGPNP